jgi:4-hydroxythreonine-4-phosphate dehydrogenase
MRSVGVVADDLSGAAEAAATFLLRTSRIVVTLHAGPGSPDAAIPRAAVRRLDVDVSIVDSNTRAGAPSAAAAGVAAAFADISPFDLAVKKIDSLLRGHLATEVIAARELRGNVVVATALPAGRRTVRDGVLLVDGVPLAESPAWRAEEASPPADLRAAFAPLPVEVVNLEIVRGAGLAAALRSVLAAGSVPVCDAETDDDLDRVVAATGDLDRPLLVGSAGLTAAVARSLPAAGAIDTAAFAPSRRADKVIVVVGSAATSIPGQLAALADIGVQPILVAPDELAHTASTAAITRQLLLEPAAVVACAIDPRAPVDPRRSAELSRALAAVVEPAARQASGLVLTGGETARTVLDTCTVSSLRPLRQVHHGAVVCLADTGQLVATRPGSYGTRTSLRDIVETIQQLSHSQPTVDKEPV